MLLESIRMSWENIINNKLRSFLTMLGIVIGLPKALGATPNRIQLQFIIEFIDRFLGAVVLILVITLQIEI